MNQSEHEYKYEYMIQKIGNSPLRAIRAKCYDCTGGTWPDVRACTIVGCALYEFRLGRRPVPRQKRE